MFGPNMKVLPEMICSLSRTVHTSDLLSLRESEGWSGMVGCGMVDVAIVDVSEIEKEVDSRFAAGLEVEYFVVVAIHDIRTCVDSSSPIWDLMVTLIIIAMTN